MGYPTKIQLIKRAKSEQWYVNFPAAVAQAIEFQQGEVVEWIIDDHQRLVLQRSEKATEGLKKCFLRKPEESFRIHLFQCKDEAFWKMRTWTKVTGASPCLADRQVRLVSS